MGGGAHPGPHRRHQIRHGGGGMPAGLVTGKDLALVADYVRSLQ